MLRCVTFHLLYELSDYAVGTALSPTLTMGMPATGPGISQALVSPGHQCRSTEVRSQDCSNHGSGPALGTRETAHTLPWPNHHMYVPTNSTAAKARANSAVGALIHSDVLQALSLQSQLRGYKSTVCAATRRDFSSSSLVTWPPGAQLWFQPHLCLWAIHRCLLLRLPWSI